MTATVPQLADAIASTLTTAGLRTTSYLADTFSAPCCLVAVKTVTYHEAFGIFPLGMYTFDLLLIVPRVSDRTAIESLEGYMSSSGTTSVRAILEADQTLGGVADQVIVRTAGPMAGLSITPTGGTPVVYTSLPFSVEVYSQ